MTTNQMRHPMEAVKDVFDLLPDDQGTAKRLEMADRDSRRDGRVAWDVYQDQPQELARRAKLLAQHPQEACLYARFVLNQPWHQVAAIDAAIARQAEQSIASDSDWAYLYAREVLRRPWHQVKAADSATARQAEQSIASNSKRARKYIQHFVLSYDAATKSFSPKPKRTKQKN